MVFRLSKKNFLANEYYTLINNLPRLSQDEIVTLYDSENIPYTDLDLEIRELEDELEENFDIVELEDKLAKLKSKRKGTAAYRYFLTVLGRKHKIRKYPSLELRNKIVEGTMYIVIINAGQVFKLENNKLSFDELVQYGMEALISAAHYYVPGGEAKFETYASKCIRNKMLRMMSDSKRMKKRNDKIKDFFTNERLRIEEIELLLNAEQNDKEYGGGFKTKTKDRIIIHRLNKLILVYNSYRDRRMEHNLKLNKVYGKTIDEVLEEYYKLLKSSKINTLLTDEDRRDVEVYLAYKNVSGREYYYLKSKCYFEIYKQKLDLIEKYIKAENSLLKKGIDTSLENIFVEINGDIKDINKKIRELKKRGFFKEFREEYGDCKRYFYKPLVYFDEEYRRVYGVENLLDEDYDDLKCKATEKEEIRECVRSQYNIYSTVIKKLKKGRTKDVYAYFDLDGLVIDVVSYIPFAKLSAADREEYEDEEQYYQFQSECDFYEFARMNRKELLNYISEKLALVEDEDLYLKRVLKERSLKVNEIIKEKNAPIIEENLKIREMEDLYNIGEKYRKYLRENDKGNLIENINLLYDDDPELVDLLLEKDKSRNRRLTVEEEVFNNLFLEDYYEALKDLDDLQRKILELYYDANGCSPLTLKEVADVLGISLSKVKTEKAKALKKLRKNEKLLSYYNED